MSPSEKQFDFWISNNLNVLLIGHAGVGKTSMVIDSFKRNNLKYRYFSASTMDPWVDFIGVPEKHVDENGSYLELVKPKDFRDNKVEALFFDEFNRSHKKIRNAVMELIQFKSINGVPFPNLKLVWAAINPPSEMDETTNYDVEPLDDAQKDRFQIQIELPYKPNESYFKKTFGEQKTEAAFEWWNGLKPNLKMRVSPRRLEVAVKLFDDGGNLRHVLPPESNIEKLQSALKHGSPTKKFEELMSNSSTDELKEWLKDDNNFSCVKEEIIKNKSNIDKVLPLLDEEFQVVLVSESSKASAEVFANVDKFTKLVEHLAKNSKNTTIQNAANNAFINYTYTQKMKSAGAGASTGMSLGLTNCGPKDVHKIDMLVASLPASKIPAQKVHPNTVASSYGTYCPKSWDFSSCLASCPNMTKYKILDPLTRTYIVSYGDIESGKVKLTDCLSALSSAYGTRRKHLIILASAIVFYSAFSSIGPTLSATEAVNYLYSINNIIRRISTLSRSKLDKFICQGIMAATYIIYGKTVLSTNDIADFGNNNYGIIYQYYNDKTVGNTMGMIW